MITAGTKESRQLERKELITAALYSVMIGAIFAWQFGPGDFGQAILMAHDIASGRDPYRYAVSPEFIPYPLGVIYASLPMLAIRGLWASGVFMAVSVFCIYVLILRSGQTWRLVMLLSGSFFYCLFCGQWAILCSCLGFSGRYLPVLLCKPNVSLPLALLRRPRVSDVLITAAMLAVLFVIKPDWLFVWLSQVRTYSGIHPPITVLPFGPLMVLALFKWRERRAWLIFLASLMPQRMIYDQFMLLLVANNVWELAFLTVLSWVTIIVKMFYPYFGDLPGGWQQWVVCPYYVPALLVLYRPEIFAVARRLLRIKEKVKKDGLTEPVSTDQNEQAASDSEQSA